MRMGPMASDAALPARSRHCPLIRVPVVSVLRMVLPVGKPAAMPLSASLQLKETLTGPRYQVLAGACAEGPPVSTGGVLSILTLSNSDVVLPAKSLQVAEIVWPAPSELRVLENEVKPAI